MGFKAFYDPLEENSLEGLQFGFPDIVLACASENNFANDQLRVFQHLATLKTKATVAVKFALGVRRMTPGDRK